RCSEKEDDARAKAAPHVCTRRPPNYRHPHAAFRAADTKRCRTRLQICSARPRTPSHWGIDPWGIARATQANWAAGGIAEGGSTITQQLAKMQIVGNERNLGRKVREAFTAIWLDLRLGKDEVLTRYLNAVYLGAGAYGMSAATGLYFDKSLADLTLPEAALLVGLIQFARQRNKQTA